MLLEAWCTNSCIVGSGWPAPIKANQVGQQVGGAAGSWLASPSGRILCQWDNLHIHFLLCRISYQDEDAHNNNKTEVVLGLEMCLKMISS